MKPIKTVKVGDQECVVETLREWLNDRIASLRFLKRLKERDGGSITSCACCAETEGRLVELLIIREKINDGRIQEIQ